MGPRLSVGCPHCGADAPAGLPRNITLLAITGRPYVPEGPGSGTTSHVQSRCPSGHEVHVYYERRFVRNGTPFRARRP